MGWFRRKKNDSDPEDRDRPTGPLGAPDPAAESVAPKVKIKRNASVADLVERLRATGLTVSDAPNAKELMMALEAEGWDVLIKKRKEGLYFARASNRGTKSKQGRSVAPATANSAGKTPLVAVVKLYLKLHPSAPEQSGPAGT